jgi:hypothetical protein
MSLGLHTVVERYWRQMRIFRCCCHVSVLKACSFTWGWSTRDVDPREPGSGSLVLSLWFTLWQASASHFAIILY